MLREYAWRGYTWQFEESEAPVDAVPIDYIPAAPKKAVAKSNKAATPARNKRKKSED